MRFYAKNAMIAAVSSEKAQRSTACPSRMWKIRQSVFEGLAIPGGGHGAERDRVVVVRDDIVKVVLDRCRWNSDIVARNSSLPRRGSARRSVQTMSSAMKASTTAISSSASTCPSRSSPASRGGPTPRSGARPSWGIPLGRPRQELPWCCRDRLPTARVLRWFGSAFACCGQFVERRREPIDHRFRIQS